MIGSSASGGTNNSGGYARHYDWINLRNPLGHHGNTGQPYSLAFRVKFWVPAHLILQESVRNIFYMQAKNDLLDGRLRAPDWEFAARLGALLAHGDEIIFDLNALNGGDDDSNDDDDTATTNATATTTIVSIDAMTTPNNQTHMAHRYNSDVDAIVSMPMTSTHTTNGTTQALDEDDDCNSVASTSDITAVGCVPLGMGMGSLGGSKDTVNKSKKRKLSKQKLSLDNDDDESDNDSIDLRELSPLRVYEDYVIQVEDGAGSMPASFLRQIAIEHSKLVKTMPKSAKYWLLQTIFKLPGFGEETFSGIRVQSTSGHHHTTSAITRCRNTESIATDWSDYVKSRTNTNCHDSSTAQRCDISVGPHGLLITTSDEQTR